MAKPGISWFTTVADKNVSLGQAAERLGAPEIWLGEGDDRDPFFLLSSLAGQTQRLRLGAGSVDIYSRHPVSTARAAATLHEQSGGRAALMVGAGVPYRLQQSYGISADHPARRAREYLTVVRKSLNNEGDAFDGDFFQVPQCGIGFEVGPASLPVYLAARLPQMLQTAGELADGVFAITITPEYASDQMPHWVECGARRASRSLEDVRMGVFVPGCLAEDPELAYQATRRFLGVRLMNPSTARLYALMGFTDEVQRFGEKAAARDMPGAFAQISERMIAGLTFSGRPADARGRLRAYENAGMQRVVAQIFEAPGSLNVEQSMDWLLTE